MSIKSFLTHLPKLIQTKSIQPLRFVTGNQSADLDSVISAISYSFLNYKFDRTVSIPLINIPREDFKLRRDIKLALESHSITEEHLFFLEDFVALSENVEDPIELVLVDHCNLQGEPLIQAFEAGNVKVVAIIDHHADENVFLDASPRVIRTSGSCASLVYNYWHEKIDQAFGDNGGELASLLLAPILIDTSNMMSKVEQDDTQAYASANVQRQAQSSFLQTFKAKDPLKDYYKQLKSAKKDLSGFKFNEVLRKDYKQFTFGGIAIGFSSTARSFNWVFDTYTNDEILDGVTNVVDTFKLDALVVTPSFTDDQDQYHRQFGVFYDKNTQFPLLGKLAQLCEQELQLNESIHAIDKFQSRVDEINEHKVFVLKNQGNLAASRKQIVPIVKNNIELNV